MSEMFVMLALIVLMLAVIVAAGCACRLMKEIRELLKSSSCLNTEALGILRYRMKRGHEQGDADALKRERENAGNA